MENIAEVWVSVVGYEGLYEVSNLGQVRSVDRPLNFSGTVSVRAGIMLRLCRDKYGYDYVNLSKLGRMKHKTVHRLVALAFIPNPENRSQVNHINGVKHDNRVENLEWATPKENRQHAARTGLNNPVRGEASPNAKLTDAMVLEIKASPHITGRALAAKYGVKPGQISRIRTGKRWAHVGPKPDRERFTAMRKGESNPSRGENQPNAKLTDAMVLEIKASPNVSGRELAVKYGVKPSVISRIRTGKLWAHVGPKSDWVLYTGMRKGESNPGAKITAKDVFEIRSIQGWSQAAIADLYGIGQQTVGRIRARKIWQHI